MPVVLTIDTEPDNAWMDRHNPSVRNVLELARLHDVLQKYGARMTCLVTSRVIADEACAKLLNRLADEGAVEIGAHLHPWETAPFLENRNDTKYSAFAHELPLDLFEEKLRNLTAVIEATCQRPTSYRGGRWSIVPEHVPILEKLHYRVDSSVVPLQNWRETLGIPSSEGGKGGVDFRSAPRNPYRLSRDDLCREGDSSLVEVPVTVTFSRMVPAAMSAHFAAIPRIIQRILRKSGVVEPVWFFPAQTSEALLRRGLAVVLAGDIDVVNIAFHSSELFVNGSPRSGTREDVDTILRRIELMISVLSDIGCRFLTLTEFAETLNVKTSVATR